MRYLLLTVATLLMPAAHAGQAPTFDNAIKPIMEKHCVSCHSGWFPKSGLRLDTRENILEGGKQGRAVIPGKPEKGWLVNMIQPQGGNPSKMPPGPVQLTPQEITTIKRWIAAGAR
ncbi:c-type cytochrome domain-containing protein [Motiliproteus sediminis]|uniref:c-type cytochrome domain-containing protein n=1 Tax=Motiliproteus sediminis TaxID=1468178 RepID=UPI001AEF82F8|nr:c-type cytochrome domain-containing protein [Motiliproteus sediminis]